MITGFPHSRMLGVLARAEPAGLKAMAEDILPDLGEITVVQNRTGLVMLPMRDTAGGVNFHLGEVLMSEARITASGAEGYGMRRGRDLEAAMAMAVIDLAVTLGHRGGIAAYLERAAQTLDANDAARLRDVAATRVDMETF